MKNIKNFLRPASIVSALPNTIQNGQTADATPLMADLNHLVNQVNANAAPLSNTALLDAANTFTAVQSGVAATAAANFPITTQVQNSVFLSLTSTLGTNSLTARCAALSLGAYTSDQMFVFIPSQTNTGAVGITIDSAGSSSMFANGVSLIGGELQAGVPALIKRDTSKFNLMNPENANGTVSSTFTWNGSGGSTGSITMTYQLSGNFVTLNIPILSATTGTSSTSLVSNTALPTAIRPLSEQGFPCSVFKDNTINIASAGVIAITAAGIISFTKDNVPGAFTNSAAAGTTQNVSITYFIG